MALSRPRGPGTSVLLAMSPNWDSLLQDLTRPCSSFAPDLIQHIFFFMWMASSLLLPPPLFSVA
uniref:Uncharacterized protein n=1 Tax=Arundo donax TaxID=35708 RepID=A0A0A9HI60_ARUDO